MNEVNEEKKEEKKFSLFKKKPQANVDKPSLGNKLKSKILGYRRVLEVARKPDKEEFTASAKITALGMGVLGLIGFVIYLVYIFIGHGVFS